MIHEGGLLNKNNYEKFSLEPMKQIIKEFKKESDVPVILFTRGGGNWLPLIIESVVIVSDLTGLLT